MQSIFIKLVGNPDPQTIIFRCLIQFLQLDISDFNFEDANGMLAGIYQICLIDNIINGLVATHCNFPKYLIILKSRKTWIIKLIFGRLKNIVFDAFFGIKIISGVAVLI